MNVIKFPTQSHKIALEETVNFFKKKKEVSAITLVGSVLRNQGSYNADIDVDIFVPDKDIEHKLTNEFLPFKDKVVERLRKRGDTGKFFDIGFHVLTLPDDLAVPTRSWISGPDYYEIIIAHFFVYCRLMFEQNKLYAKTRKKYIPYYSEKLRKKRLEETLKFCLNNIQHVEPYARRGLHIQALKRIRHATEEFIQALFISKKVYPLDYDKWVKYELEKILKLPDLYRELISIYELKKMNNENLIIAGRKLEKLIHKYISKTI